MDNSQDLSNAGMTKGTTPVIAKPIMGLRNSAHLKQNSINSSLNHSNFMKTVDEKDLGALKKELEYQKAIKEYIFRNCNSQILRNFSVGIENCRN